MTLYDLNMIRVLGIIVTCCFFIGFIIAALCNRWLPMGRTFWFTLAGFSSILVLLAGVNIMLGGMPIAGARTMAGLIFQGLAGGLGGWLFAKLSQTKSVGVAT